jgi:hypothetical protein
VLSLPVWPEMTEAEVELVADAVVEYADRMPDSATG